MGFRFRKSFKIAPGIRTTISKSGISTRIGGKGFSVSKGKRGTRMNVGIPGTGISYSTKIGGKSKKASVPSTAQTYGKSSVLAFLICLFAGIIGLHWLYLGNKKRFLIYLCTFGLFGFGWLFDCFRFFIEML